MNKEQAAAFLREAASRIESSDFDGDGIAVNINFHKVKTKEQLVSALKIMDEGTVTQDRSRGTHWAKGAFNGMRFSGIEVTVFFNPELVGKVKKKVTTTTKIAMGTVADLLKGEAQ
jgi:hypothetical protein